MDKRTWIIVGGTAIVSGAAGVVGGFFYAKKTLVDGYTAILNAEVEEIREIYRRRTAMKTYSSPQEAAAELLPEKEQLTTPEEKLGAETLLRNIFGGVEEDDEEEIEREVEARTPNDPYVISQEEFFADEMDFRQLDVTYYEGDKVLADDQDEPITNVNKHIGESNLRFGYRSKDQNLVYVRNEELGVEFAIARSTGKYSQEVLGLDEEPKPTRQRSNGR